MQGAAITITTTDPGQGHVKDNGWRWKGAVAPRSAFLASLRPVGRGFHARKVSQRHGICGKAVVVRGGVKWVAWLGGKESRRTYRIVDPAAVWECKWDWEVGGRGVRTLRGDDFNSAEGGENCWPKESRSADSGLFNIGRAGSVL